MAIYYVTLLGIQDMRQKCNDLFLNKTGKENSEPGDCIFRKGVISAVGLPLQGVVWVIDFNNREMAKLTLWDYR